MHRELLEFSREIVFFENFLGKITLENSPRDFWTSGAIVIICCPIPPANF